MDNCILQSRRHFLQKGKVRATGTSLFLLMLLLAFSGTMKADEVTIGSLDGAANNSYLPMNSLYNYSYTQQIYTADEIGMAGTINSITMWLYGNANLVEMPFNIYMVEVDKASFLSTTDWVTVAETDIVYTGSIHVTNTEAQAFTFTLDTPFHYSGTGNLLIAFNNLTGTWKSGLNGMVFDAGDSVTRAIYARQDSGAYDPYNPTFNAASYTTLRDVVVFDITSGGGGAPAELTVYDGTTTNGNVPVYGFYADAYLKCEMLYPADILADMAGGTINQMTFYASQSSVNWGTSFQVIMADAIGDATINGYYGLSVCTVVYEGALSIVDNQMVVTFDSPFKYNGGNLVVGVYQTNTGSYITSTWYGETVSGASVSGYNYSGLDAITSATQQNFLPKTKFDYTTAGGGPVGPAGPTIAGNPETIEFGYRPNGYWMEPLLFELVNTGTEGTITSVEPTDAFFELDVEVPFTLAKNESLMGVITTGSTATAGEINAQLAVQYEGEGLNGSATAYVDVTATAYDAVSPDVWELAEEVTSFPFQTTTTTDDLYLNYNLPGIKPESKDAVYKVTFDNDVLLSAGTNGANHVTKVYSEGFNGEGGPGQSNYYTYNGPEVGPGPVNMWFSYDYTGSNTWFGTSAGGGMYFGYKIPVAKIQELGLENASIYTLEAAAREAVPYDAYIMEGGTSPEDATLVSYTSMDFTPQATYFFDLNLSEPVAFNGQDMWVIFYSTSAYAAYCGRYPVDTENGQLWYNTNGTWNGSTNYTPMIYAHFMELPSGRDVTVNLSDMTLVANGQGEVAEAEGNVMGVSKGQIAQAHRGNRDVQTLIEEGFEGGSMPTGWTQEGDGTWSIGSGDYSTSTGSANGDYNALITHSTSGNNTYLITPAMDLSNATSATVSCNYINRSWSGDIDGFGIYYRVEGGDWNELFYTTTAHSAYTQCEVELEGMAANYQIGFKHYDSYGYGVGLDDVVVTADITTGGGNTPTVAYQIEDMYVPAGTYYVVVASTTDNFQVDMAIAEVPTPVQAYVTAPYNNEPDVEFPYIASWVLGDYTKEMQVLYGTDYPPTTTLIDWTSELVESAFLPELPHNRMFFIQVNERNETGTTEGEIISFTTPFDLPQNFAAVTPYIYEGDTAVFTWDAIEDDEFLGYRVARVGWGSLHANLLTETTVSDPNIVYNMNGYLYYIEAVYENGSVSSNYYTVYASGNGTIQGTVYEQDGQTPIPGVTVSFHGYDEFNLEKSFSIVTDEAGEYSMDLLAGYYDTIWASCQGYQTKYYNDFVNLAYQDTISGIDFILDEVFAPVSEVIVNYNPDENDPNSPYVKIDWVNDNRALNHYRVYRTDYDNDGPYSVYNTEMIAEVTGETSTIDEGWQNLNEGLYKYGVSCVYEGNRDAALSNLTENFDEGTGRWTTYDADGDGSCWMLGSQAALVNNGHNGSADMMISKSFENGQSICPDNYLISPLVHISQFSEFSFWACAQDANYAGEYFQVMFSPGSELNQYGFVAVAGWSLDSRDLNRGERNSRAQGTWYKFEADLTQFAGQEGYIAIRHCQSCGNFYLDIDDVELFDANAQVDRESEIVWSDPIGKDMYLGEGEVNVTIAPNSGDSPAGATLTIVNLSEPEYVLDPVTFDETGYYAWGIFRKGEYELTIEMEDYETIVATESIWAPTDLYYYIGEIMLPVANLQVSSSGYATWDALEQGGRHFTGNFLIEVYSSSGWLVWSDYTTETEVQIPEDELYDGLFTVEVSKEYSSGFMSVPLTKTFQYKSCGHYPGVNNFYAKMVDEGVYMSWNYPEFDTTTRANRETWDLLNYFSATSGYQYGIATDGNYIYTSSWSASSTSQFYKYDMNGNFIEEFNIDGSGQIRDLTYDGTYFYGVANANTIYCLDLANHALVGTITSAYGTMRCCTYDSQRDGFWVVGNWSGNLSLVDRSGNVVFTGPTPTSASGVAYYMDRNGGEHVLISNNGNGYVYDYNIATSTIDANYVCDLSTIPGYAGSTGGCHVGYYNGKLAFFADIQQGPQLIGIFELEESLDMEYHTIMSANIYYNGELVDNIGPDQANYTFVGEEYEQGDVYSIELLFEDHLHGCVQDAYMLSKFDVLVTNMYAHHPDEYTTYAEPCGTILGLGEYLELDTCTLIVVPDEEHSFNYWYNVLTGEYVYGDTITFVVDYYHRAYLAYFEYLIHEQNTEFVPGWNWWSTYIEQNNNNGFEQMTTQLNSNGSMITSQTAFAQSYGDYGYYGSLNSLTNESMYKVKLVDAVGVYAVMSGHYVDVDAHPITLSKGWNWVGYMLPYGNALDYVFSNMEPSDGDMVKTQYAYANYYEGYGWYGSLSGVWNGEGLMYKSVNDEDVTFTLPQFNKGSEFKENLRGNHWTVNHNDYPNNMTVMAVVKLNDEELQSENYEIGAFVNGVCRGSIPLLYVEPIDRYVAFLTISGESDEELTFGLYNATTDEERFDSETTLTFVADAMIGGFENPFEINFRGTTGLNELSASMRLYPNPVAQGEQISINLAAQPVRIEILNALGEVVVVENEIQQPINIAAPTTPGVYTVRVITESKGVVSHKIIVK